VKILGNSQSIREEEGRDRATSSLFVCSQCTSSRTCACSDRSRDDVVGVCVTHVRYRGGVLRSPEGPGDPPLGLSPVLLRGGVASLRLDRFLRLLFFFFSLPSSLLADGSGVRANERALIRHERPSRQITPSSNVGRDDLYLSLDHG